MSDRHVRLHSSEVGFGVTGCRDDAGGPDNRAKSRIRARIEHVFGTQETAPGGRILRTIGVVRARLKIGLQNLVYNIRRLVTLERMAAA